MGRCGTFITSDLVSDIVNQDLIKLFVVPFSMAKSCALIRTAILSSPICSSIVLSHAFSPSTSCLATEEICDGMLSLNARLDCADR
jgi:hypothetical protein